MADSTVTYEMVLQAKNASAAAFAQMEAAARQASAATGQAIAGTGTSATGAGGVFDATAFRVSA